jgi:hypothetical protein
VGNQDRKSKIGTASAEHFRNRGEFALSALIMPSSRLLGYNFHQQEVALMFLFHDRARHIKISLPVGCPVMPAVTR